MRFISSWPLAVVACFVAIAGAQAPRIDKIDPPEWWVGLPSPMLLLHGEGLDKAQLAVSGKGVKLTRSQTSANGHWAFLWIDTDGAAAQSVAISASDNDGHASTQFALGEPNTDKRIHAGFSAADVLYLIMTDRFAQGDAEHAPAGEHRELPRGWHGGDFAGIEKHLDYLKELGVTAVWTTPVASNGAMPESYHGYSATDLYATDAHFGTLAVYRHLSDALHAKGMKLVIDLVPNHVGVEHPWVNDSPTPDWFHGTLAHHSGVKGDFNAVVDPHAPEAAWHDVTNGWFTDAMPDLNQENPLVEQYLIQNALWWVEKANLDGIRLDTFPYVGRAFWHDFHATLHKYYPHVTTVGEVFDGDAEVTSFFAGGVARRGIDSGLDTPFDFPVYFALRDVLAHDKPMTDLARVLRQDALYPHAQRLVTFLGNHDTVRIMTATGGSVAKQKLALGLTMTMRGMPQIYSGDEIGMTGSEDPDNRHDFPGGFTGDTHNAFARDGRTGVEQDLFAWTSQLAQLRRDHSELSLGREEDLLADENLFAFVRTNEAAGCAEQPGERMLTVVNKGKTSTVAEIRLDKTALAGCKEFRAVMAAGQPSVDVNDERVRISEPPESMTVFAVR